MLSRTMFGAVTRVITLFMLVLAARSGEAWAHNFSERHVLLVIDRSGSMQLLRSNGETRFAEAIKQSRDFVNMYSPLPKLFAVWTFEADGYQRHQGFANATTTLATLQQLHVGNGATPLAYAICDAVDELLQYRPGVVAEKVVRLVSDGEENSTPPSSRCHGPSSLGRYPNLTSGSWQWKVRNMLMNGDPLRDDPGTFRLVFDANVFYDYIGDAVVIRSPAGQASPLKEGSSPSVHPMLSLDYFAFLQSLSLDSGGTFTAINDTKPAPVVGDTNQDFCVDRADYDLVLSNYGYAVPPANPAADVNHDGRVDYYDQYVVVDHFGSGCSAVMR